jgi:hypothetical protein
MVIRILSFALASVAVALFALMARAAEPPKSECPKECEMRARAAFAFAKEKAKADAKAAATTTPAPAPKVSEKPEKKVGRNCICGDNCQCAAGDCPSKCPVTAVAVVAEAVKAKPPPAFVPKRIVGYTCGIDQYGRRVCVPVYEQ